MTTATTLKVKELSLKNTLLHSHFKMGHLEQMPYGEMLENAIISLVEKQEKLESKLLAHAQESRDTCNLSERERGFLERMISFYAANQMTSGERDYAKEDMFDAIKSKLKL